MQSAQTVSAAYDFDLAARDYALADRAIEPVTERLPCSAFIKTAQSCELIFCGHRIRCEGRDMLRIVANFVAICKSTGDRG